MLHKTAKLWSVLIAFTMLFSIALPAFASSINLNNSVASTSSMPAGLADSDLLGAGVEKTQVLFINTTPYTMEVTIGGYKNDFQKHFLWYDEEMRSIGTKEQIRVNPGCFVYLNLSKAKFRKAYSFVYKIDIITGYNVGTSVRFDDHRQPFGAFQALDCGDGREFQISECIDLPNGKKGFIDSLVNKVVDGMKISPSSKWHKVATTALRPLLAKGVEKTVGSTDRYQVTLSLTERVQTRSSAPMSSYEIRPVLWSNMLSGLPQNAK